MATQTKAMVFNPAAIHDNTINTFDVNTSNHESLVSTFVVEGEVISRLNSVAPNAKVYGKEIIYSENKRCRKRLDNMWIIRG